MKISIHTYADAWKEAFKLLNEEWLKKHFSIEPKDIQLLSDPKTQIIDRGGEIFFAEYEGAIVGTVALIPHGTGMLELGKMAVTERVQGFGIGKALMEHCIAYAHTNNVQTLFLYSNTKLDSAIHLYRKYGFTEVSFEPGPYKRTNIKMEKKR